MVEREDVKDPMHNISTDTGLFTFLVKGEVLGHVNSATVGMRSGKSEMTVITESSPGGTQRWLVQRLRTGLADDPSSLTFDLVPQENT